MRHVFGQSFQDSFFSGRLLISFLVLVGAFLVSLGMMFQEYSDRLENYEDSFSMKGEELFYNNTFYWKYEDGRTSNSDTLTFPMGVVKKPSPLLLVARGMDKQMRHAVEFVSTFPIIDISVSPDQETNSFKKAFEAPDLLLILKVLASMLAILFSYNLVCGEKERGTLKLLLVNGGSRISIYFGKYLGYFVSLQLSFSAAYLVYVFAVQIISPDSLAGDTPVRLLLIWLTAMLHLAVFFSIGAMISSFFKESSYSLIVGLFVWLIVVFALPGMSSLIAKQFVQVESEETVARKKLEKAQQMEAEYAETHPEDKALGRTAGYGLRHDEIRDEVVSAMKKIDDVHKKAKHLQADMTTTLARISPIGSLTYLVTSLSGTGIEDVRQYHDDLVRIRNNMDKLITGMLQAPDFEEKYLAGGFYIPKEAKEPMLEAFEIGHKQGFSSTRFEESLQKGLADFFLLFIFCIVPAAIGFIRFMRYDPR